MRNKNLKDLSDVNPELEKKLFPSEKKVTDLLETKIILQP